MVAPAESADRPYFRSHQVDEQVTLTDLIATAVGFVVVIGTALLQSLPSCCGGGTAVFTSVWQASSEYTVVVHRVPLGGGVVK